MVILFIERLIYFLGVDANYTFIETRYEEFDQDNEIY